MAKIEIKDWISTARARYFNWAGHIYRRTDGRWSKQILDWIPEGGPRQGGKGRGRKQSRPHRRWEDALDKYFKHALGLQTGEWRIVSMDRDMWNAHLDAFSKFDSTST